MKVTIKELTIESDEDFSHVNIDFSKGSFSTSTSISNNIDSNKTPKDKKDIFKDAILDLDEDFSHDITEVVEKPVIEETERDVHVSEDMINAEF